MTALTFFKSIAARYLWQIKKNLATIDSGKYQNAVDRKMDLIFPEQEALIPVYREKWKQIGLSTERINKESAAYAIQKAYAFIDLPSLKLYFVIVQVRQQNFYFYHLTNEEISLLVNSRKKF